MLRTNKALSKYIKTMLCDKKSGRPLRTITAFRHQIEYIYEQIEIYQDEPAFIELFGEVQWDKDGEEAWTTTKPLLPLPSEIFEEEAKKSRKSTSTKPIKISTVSSSSSTTTTKKKKEKKEKQNNNLIIQVMMILSFYQLNSIKIKK